MKLLFTSAGRRVVLLREFQRAAAELDLGLELHAVDAQPMAPALQEASVAAIAPRIDSGQYIPFLLDYCRRNAIDALVPLIDTELGVLAAAREDFARYGTRAVVCSPRVVDIAADKLKTAAFLADNNLPGPRILAPRDLDNPTFPILVKPQFGSASLDVNVIRTQHELDYYRRSGRGDLIFQQYIRGREHTVDAFTDFRGNCLCAVPRLRHEVRAGEVSKSQTVRNATIIAQTRHLVGHLKGCVGMVTVQCFLTAAGEVVFIEINPRFGGGAPLSIRAGADSPRWLLELLLGRRPAIDEGAWTDGMLMLRYDDAFFVTPGDLPH
ncbi:MAG: ATP-grasp domain-containing protein [Planctomycetaceae bacterium]|nr:ATP-grasp domain-containing protein [Planctomycetaceae bacterium]